MKYVGIIITVERNELLNRHGERKYNMIQVT
jgi:hypothetical protein